MELNFTAAASAAATTTTTAAGAGAAIVNSATAIGAAGTASTPPSLPPSLITELQAGCKAVVMKGKSVLLLREGQGGLSPLGWEFTPANRRMVFEIASSSSSSSSPASSSSNSLSRFSEGEEEEEKEEEEEEEEGEEEQGEEEEGGVVWRFSGEVRRKPKNWCHVTGTIRVRPSSLPSSLPPSPPSSTSSSHHQKEDEEEGRREGGKKSPAAPRRPRRAIPSTNPAWPVVATFQFEKEMAPFQPLSKWEKVLIWARLEAPKFSNTKAGRKAKIYLREEGGREGGEEEEWNAQALKYKMWKYFDV